jgi:murein L,D-transpeptidase YcbB/YkuD
LEFSHGCIEYAKAKGIGLFDFGRQSGLASDKIDRHGWQVFTYVLKNKTPIHIGYFTAWYLSGKSIYFDLYHKDYRLAELLLMRSPTQIMIH